MSYYNLCGIWSQYSNISKGKRGVHIKITGMQDSNQGRNRNKNVTLNICPSGSYE
jgi:hypothetical protein